MQLVVTATRREADAVLRSLGPATPDDDGHRYLPSADLLVAVSGIGQAEAAATTARICARRATRAVFSVGVAGGFGVPVGTLVIAGQVTRADTGVQQADGRLLTLREAVGFGDSTIELGPDRLARLADRLPGATVGRVLTVATVTGTAERAAALLAAAPGTGPAVEEMEAWGVLVGCPRDVPFFAVKAVCNPVGPRDRDSWDLDGALAVLSETAERLFAAPPDWL